MRSLVTLFTLFVLAQITLVAQSAPFQLIYGSDNSQEVAVGSAQIADGSIYMVGNVFSDTTIGQDVLLVKVSPAGEVLWSRSYDNGQSEFAQDFIIKNDQLIIAGESNLVGGFDKNAFILKLDLDGNKLDFNLYGVPDKGEQFQGITATTGGYIACGYKSSAPGTGNDIFVQYFGAGFIDSWTKTYGAPVNDISMAALELPNGNFAISGDRLVDSVTYNAILLILDPRGDLLHETIIASPYNGGCKNLTLAADGNILLLGELATPTSTAFDAFLSKLTPQGDILWTTYVPSSDFSDAGFSICEVNPGSLVIGGYSYNLATGNTDIVAISVDSLGQEVERKYYGGPGLDIAYDIKLAQSGGLLLAGKTYFGNHHDAILIHDYLTLATSTSTPALPVEKLDISPNPAQSGTNLQLREFWLGGHWELLDVFGKSMAQGIVSQSLTVGELPVGTYFLRVKKAGKIGAEKLVIAGF